MGFVKVHHGQNAKNPSRGVFSAFQEKLLLDAGSVFFVFFFGAVDFFVVHLATAVGASEGGHGDQHESGNESSHHEFHKNTFTERLIKGTRIVNWVYQRTDAYYQAIQAEANHGQNRSPTNRRTPADFRHVGHRVFLAHGGAWDGGSPGAFSAR
jgi:hypothetical protein